jgi:hypothetical protein
MNEEFTAKQSPVEELTMPTTDLNPSPVAPQTEDWGMTNPLKKTVGRNEKRRLANAGAGFFAYLTVFVR